MNVHGKELVLDARALKAWRTAITVMFGLGGVTVAAWGPRLAAIRSDLGLGDGGIGLVLAGITVGSIGGLTASSVLMTRFGARTALRAVFGSAAVGLALLGPGAGVAHSIPVAAVAFVAIGFSIGAADVMINVEGSAIERAVGRTLLPMMHAAWSAGVIAGAGIGAACSRLHIAFQWQFVGEAVLIAVTATGAARSVPVRPMEGKDDSTDPRSERLRRWLASWTDGRLLLIGLVMLGVELGEGSANSWLTLAVHDGHGQSDAVAGLFFAAFATGETVARLLGGPLVDRFGRVLTVRLTTAVGVVGLALFIATDSSALVLLGTVLWAVGVSMGFPLGMSAAADSGVNPTARVSVVASIGYLASLGGPPMIGLLSQRFGLLQALWLVVILLAIGFAAAGALRVSPKATANDPH